MKKFLASILLAFAASVATAADVLPRDSVYQLALPLTDQQGQHFNLAARRGQPMVVSMFYTSCEFVCPMLVDAIQATQRKLTPAERERLNVLLVSFDPARDTVEVLHRTAGQRQLDAHWSLVRTEDAHVRKLAAVLDIQYRALANGDFNHSTTLVLLDADGRVVARTSELGRADPAFVKAVKTALAAPRS
jgi:protein SCO1/2